MNFAYLRKMTPYLLSLLGLVVCCQAVSAESTLSPEARRDLQLRPGVVLIFVPIKGSIPELRVKCPDGQGVMGSGFIYRPDGYVITNGHVAQLANVKDADAKVARRQAIVTCLAKTYLEQLSAQRQQEGKASLTDAERVAIYRRMQQYLEEGKITLDEAPAAVRVCLDNTTCMNGEIKAYSDPFIDTANPGKDVAIIKIDGHDLPTVPFGNSDDMRVNDPIEVIGYPGDAMVSSISTFVATTTEGIVSAVKRLDRPDMQILQTSTVINPGNSGGPAFDRQGRVIGIATFKSGENYSYLVPLSAALEFVRAAGVEPQRGPFDTLWNDALQAYSDKHWEKAHKLAQDVLEILPKQPEAERLSLEAADNQRKQGPESSLDSVTHSVGGMGGVAGLGVLAVAAVIAAWFFMRRSRRQLDIAPGGGSSARVGNALARGSSSGATTERIVSEVPAAAPQNYGTLHVSGGPLAGNRFPIPKEGLLIGRDASRCRIVIPETAISGEHAWVVPLDNGVVVIDRNSSNGTYINTPDSARVSKVVLRHGDRIYLGTSNQTILTYFSA